jgi:hypothetical protein
MEGKQREDLFGNLFNNYFMKKYTITVTPDWKIKALDTRQQTYVYLENKLVDENGQLTFWTDGHELCFKNLTNDPIADSIKKIRARHGRTPAAILKETLKANKLGGYWGFMKRVIWRFHS